MDVTKPEITAAQLAALVLGRPTAVIVQDATGTIHSLDYLNRIQLDDPDVVVLMTRDEAVAALESAARTATIVLEEQGVLA